MSQEFFLKLHLFLLLVVNEIKDRTMSILNGQFFKKSRDKLSQITDN